LHSQKSLVFAKPQSLIVWVTKNIESDILADFAGARRFLVGKNTIDGTVFYPSGIGRSIDPAERSRRALGMRE